MFYMFYSPASWNVIRLAVISSLFFICLLTELIIKLIYTELCPPLLHGYTSTYIHNIPFLRLHKVTVFEIPQNSIVTNSLTYVKKYNFNIFKLWNIETSKLWEHFTIIIMKFILDLLVRLFILVCVTVNRYGV